jgi:TPP-dependent pyruvate/acetoin dehydrogenase alpha subunit
LREIDEELREMIEDALAIAKAAPKPTPDALYTDVYASY